MEIGSAQGALSTSTLLIPARGRAFIRRIETEENYPGSPILIPEHIRDKVVKCQFEVVRLGDYRRCKNEDCTRRHAKGYQHAHNLELGDWVLCKHRSWMETDDPHVFVIWTDDILGKFCT
jgi:hypothetical protein